MKHAKNGRWYVLALVLTAAAPADAQLPREEPLVEQVWWQGDRPCRIAWMMDGRAFFSTARDTVEGRFQGQNVTVGNLQGTLSRFGPTRTITWSNQTRWTRTEIAGPYTINRKGKAEPCEVFRRGDVYFFLNEKGSAVARGRFVSGNTVSIPDWNMTVTVEQNQGRLVLRFANGDVWVQARR